ncbi:AbrB family transcriptional regulator [Devosia sp. A8/3-2]|nr:AbrB family transcriptional regulator [Devosia sp. A8/3-2]
MTPSPARSLLQAAYPTLLTPAVSAAGGAIATALGMPAGWLMGGALAVTAAAMAGLPMSIPNRLRDVVFVLVGMMMGANVAPDSLSLIASWPVSWRRWRWNWC